MSMENMTTEDLATIREEAATRARQRWEDETARRECAERSHLFSVIIEAGYDGPVQVICSHCGKTWDVPKVTA